VTSPSKPDRRVAPAGAPQASMSMPERADQQGGSPCALESTLSGL
jgi:hypothetical protein